MLIIEIIKAVVIGIVEGITEWLPVSSTGHLILLDELIRLDVSVAFYEMFLVVIQLGAILAVPILFWKRLNPLSYKNNSADRRQIYKIWGRVIVGSMPACLLGLILDDLLDRYFYNYTVVSIMLIIYGIGFVWVEKSRIGKKCRVNHIEEITYADALKIGAFQALSLIPGTSRSGSTILGGMISGVSREVSAEFSFFMAIPIMLGASGLKCIKYVLSGIRITNSEIVILLVGIVTSFFVSLCVISFLIDFVKRHNFKVFGYYRIALGFVIILYFLTNNVF